MFDDLKQRGFQIECHSHAASILSGDFPEAIEELESVLREATLPIGEIIAGGGGEAKGTQRLRRGLAARGWATKDFTIEKTINGERREAITHKMDHIRTFKTSEGKTNTIALEIEWNNKDPFFDRDLENFKRLHADGAISIGIIITRGRSLHEQMGELVARFCEEQDINSFENLEPWGYLPTAKQKGAILARVSRKKNAIPFRSAFKDKFVSDKFGEATTHWRKLEDRVRRGVGNPCPLVLIGLPVSIVTFGENPAEVAELIAEPDDSED